MALAWLCMCAIFYVHYTKHLPPMEGPFFFSAYMIFLYSLHFGSLRFWCSREHMWDLSNRLGQLPRIPRFFMDLLVRDSLWIYLFYLWPYRPIRSMRYWNLYSEGEGHYTKLHCWTKPHARRAQPVQCAGWGCSLFRMITTGNYSNVRWRSSSFYGGLGFILLLCTELLLLIIWHLLSI